MSRNAPSNRPAASVCLQKIQQHLELFDILFFIIGISDLLDIFIWIDAFSHYSFQNKVLTYDKKKH